MNTSIKDQITSKGFIAGYGCIGFGAYLMIADKEYATGIQLMLLGLGLIGVRDAQNG